MIEQLGPYRIEKLLGRGGMGSVYAGRHAATGQPAAIKVLALALAEDGNFRHRFASEIETLKRLDHPNIVRLFAEGEQDGYQFFVMELVDGRSLQAELQAGRQYSWREAAEIAVQICAALKHAHDRGVIHRDLKPANLLQTPQGQMKLTDFGIAKLFGASQLTAYGSVVGTADYMAPEQAEGGPITNRSDLYSLGSVLFTLLSRRPPFSAPSVAQVIHKLRYEQAPSVRRYASEVPPELEQIIDRLLQKDPGQRLPTALVVSRRLTALLETAGDTPTDEGEAPLPSDLPTRIAVPSPDAERPAEAASDAGAGRKFSWNDATVVTSHPRPEDPPPTSLPPASRKTVADERPAARPQRFATVDYGALQHDQQTEAGPPPAERWHTLALAAALMGLIALAVWWVWPPSADSLYRHISETTAQSGPADAKKQIDRFLERFPNDPRAEEIRGLQRDVEADWLQSRLALRDLKSGGTDLEPYEQMWLRARRMLETDPAAAQRLWQEILSRYAMTPQPPQSLREILQATRHQLERIGTQAGQSSRQRPTKKASEGIADSL